MKTKAMEWLMTLGGEAWAGLAPWVAATGKGVVWVGAAALVVRWIGPRSAARSSLVWSLTLAGLVLLPAATLLGPAWAVLPPVPGWVAERAAPQPRADDAARTAERSGAPASGLMPTASTVGRFEPRGPASPDFPARASRGPRDRLLDGGGTVVGRRVRGVPGQDPSVRTREQLQGGEFPLSALLLVLWSVGCGAALVPWAVGRLRLRTLARRARGATDPTLCRMAAATRWELGIRRPVTLLVGGEAAMPMTWGSLRPTLLLPDEAVEWCRERLRHVLLHELAHVARWDHAMSCIAAVACALNWFNPAVWWAAARARLERESACDDRVLTAGCRPSSYARDLLDVARSLRRPRTLAVSSIPMARGSHLDARLASILDPYRGRQGTGYPSVVLGAALVPVLVLPLAALAPAPRATSVTDRAVGPAPVAHVRQLPQSPVCATGPDGSRSISATDVGQETLRARWRGDGCRVTVEIRGEVRFAPTEDAIGSMGPGAFFSVDSTVGRLRRELEAEPDAAGRPRYTYRLDGEARPFDAEARAWLATLLPQLHRETGYGAEQRVLRLLEEGGVPAVLAEVDHIGSDSVLRTYLGLLIEHGRLTTAEFDQVLALAGRRIDSDYELAELLIHVARTEGLSSSIRETYLDAAGSLDSDYEHRRVLAVLLEQPDLEPALVDAVIASAARIDSDYELAELLIQAQGIAPLTGPGRASYLEALGGIGSDYEARRVLDGFLDHGPLSAAELRRVLELATGLASDYELAEVLVRVGRENGLSGSLADAYLAAVRSIDSDYEIRRTLSVVLEGRGMDDAGLAAVLELAHHLDSDYERAELLVQVARTYPLSAALREAYRDAARGIDSEYEQDRALAALARNEGPPARP